MSQLLDDFRAAYLANGEAFRNHDFEAAFALLPEEFEWHAFATLPDRRVFTGPRGVREMFAELTARFPDFHAEPLEFSQAGEDTFLVRCQARGTGESSGAEVELSFTQLWELQDGVPIRVREFLDHADALDAAGRPSTN